MLRCLAHMPLLTSQYLISAFLHGQHRPAHKPINKDNGNHDPQPLRNIAVKVERLYHRSTAYASSRLEVRGIHALEVLSDDLAAIGRVLELVYHHALEDIGLVVDVVKHIC